MRSRRPLISALLAAALLLGQWLAAAHEPEHALQPGAAHGCVACAYAHGAGAGALPHLPALALAGATEIPGFPATSGPRDAAPRHHPIRGPPSVLA